MIQTVTLTPKTGNESPRIFDVYDCLFETQEGHLTLHCRDGRVCLGLVGSWNIDIRPALNLTRAISCEEAERIHDGKTMVVLSAN